jgi:hypothetical protein
MSRGRHRRRPPAVDPGRWVDGRWVDGPGREGREGSYDSVEGTEGNLQWTKGGAFDAEAAVRVPGDPRLAEGGREFGRQLVTFNDWQAYPELLVTLRCMPRVEVQQPECLEPEPELEPTAPSRDHPRWMRSDEAISCRLCYEAGRVAVPFNKFRNTKHHCRRWCAPSLPNSRHSHAIAERPCQGRTCMSVHSSYDTL